MTQFLGFKNYGEEYKMMGMAAYGSPKYYDKLKNNLFKESKKFPFELNLEYFNHHKNDFKYIADDEKLIIDNIFNSKFSKLFEIEMSDKENIEKFKIDFAASVQKIYEFFFTKILDSINNKIF